MNTPASTVLLLLLHCLLPTTILGQSPAFWPEVSPDGSEVLFLRPSRGGPIYLMDADGSDVRRLAQGTHPAWFPSGRRIVAVARSDTAERLVVMNADGSDPDTLPTAYPRYVWRPSVSPDGRTIVVGDYWPTDVPNVFHIVSVTGVPLRDIRPSAPGELVEATWSHDGRLAFVAFSRDTARTIRSTTLYVMNGDGRGQRAIATLPDAAQWISWSPDDREIALQDDDLDAGDGNIVIVDVETGAVRQITHHDRPTLDETPSWSSDGHIYFQSNRSGTYEIYRMHPDGSGQRSITSPPHAP